LALLAIAALHVRFAVVSGATWPLYGPALLGIGLAGWAARNSARAYAAGGAGIRHRETVMMLAWGCAALGWSIAAVIVVLFAAD
jgi:hypothetical protein